MTGTTINQGQRLTGGAKLAVDMGPLAVFMIAYFLGQRLAPFAGGLIGEDWSIADGEEMFLAVGLFMPAFLIAFIYSVWKERRVAPMLLVTGVIVGVLGSLTLILHNKTFFYMKPTIVYALFTSVLTAGIVTRQNFLKILFDGAFHMPDEAWRKLTKRYAIFFAVLAVANEIAWRYFMRDCDLAGGAACSGEKHWVNLKVFGFTIISLVFTGFQAPLIAKHMPREEDESGKSDQSPS
ncbi:septation protein IspZ [Hyphococcus flavus]|uniref:Inner membrane-spanning protein YciB n=1 Tax=Hyphococcus flavus TaxID=1866326 RepID=A0AAE9ZHU6_9PROT|nr:inner membrane-spanning protein YciB [Hyphococcus flavus]WDI32887.1 septation protein IspZ [Hyphococcus flavus]